MAVDIVTARSPKGSVFYEFSPSPLLGNIAFLTSTGEKFYIIETVIACGSEPYCILMRQSIGGRKDFQLKKGPLEVFLYDVLQYPREITSLWAKEIKASSLEGGG